MSAARTVEQYLGEHRIPYEVVSHPRSMTSLQTAGVAHIEPDRIAKAVVLEHDEGYMMAVLPASCHIRLGQLRQVLGRDLRMASEYGICRLFPDCDIGAVPPLGTAYGVDMVWDDRLGEQDDLYFEAGDHENLLHLRVKDFIDMMGDSPHLRFSTRIM